VATHLDAVIDWIGKKVDAGENLGKLTTADQQQFWTQISAEIDGQHDMESGMIGDRASEVAFFIDNALSADQLRRLRQAVRTRAHRERTAQQSRAEVDKLQGIIKRQSARIAVLEAQVDTLQRRIHDQDSDSGT